MLISKPIEGKEFHSFFASFLSFKEFLFALSILTFFASPILGCIPILLLLQVRISKRYLNDKALNSKNISIFYKSDTIYLFLILFAIIIYGSTIDKSEQDISAVLTIYEQLDGYSIYDFINNFPDKTYLNIERLTFFIPHLAGMLFGHSDNLFLLVQSLTFNLAFVVLAYRTFPFFYPTVILINITSFYYFQHMFVMRQWYSFLFLLPMAIAPSIVTNLLFLVLAYLSHRSSLIYSIPLLFLSILLHFEKLIPFKTRSLKLLSFKIINSLFTNKIIFILFFSVTILIIPYIFNAFIQVDAVIYAKADVYQTEYDYDNTPFNLLAATVLAEFILSIIILGFLTTTEDFFRDYKEYSYLIIAITSISMMVFVYYTGMVSVFLRPILSWGALKGFFYPTFFLAIQKLKFRNKFLSRLLFLCLMSLITISILRFLMFHFLSVLITYQGGSLLNKWMNATYPLYKAFYGFGAFITYPNYFENNNIPTVASNLLDYVSELYRLIESIVTV